MKTSERMSFEQVVPVASMSIRRRVLSESLTFQVELWFNVKASVVNIKTELLPSKCCGLDSLDSKKKNVKLSNSRNTNFNQRLVLAHKLEIIFFTLTNA